MTASSSHAFAEERRATVLEMLEHRTSLQVSEIAELFGVSAVTARADLDALAAAGKLRRTHGGAVSLYRKLTVSTQDKRVNVNVDAKRLVARAARAFVHNHDTLIVDSGTTALEFVRSLAEFEGVTVITTDITIADFIDESMPNINVILLGGALRKGHRYLYGPLTMEALRNVHADTAIICPGAYVPQRGFATDFPQMAELKQAMMRAAARSIALFDASKIGARGTYVFAPLSSVTHVVVDSDPLDVLQQELDQLKGAEYSGAQTKIAVPHTELQGADRPVPHLVVGDRS